MPAAWPAACSQMKARSESSPAPVFAETRNAPGYRASSPATASSSATRSSLLKTSTVGRGSPSNSSSTASTACICRRRSGSAASTTWSSRSASTASTSVLWNEATRWCGSLRMKPTVSVSSARCALGAHHLPRGGVERGEEPVLDEHVGAGERVEERALAGVGVAHQRGAEVVAPAAALGLALALDALERALQARDASRARCGGRSRAGSRRGRACRCRRPGARGASTCRSAAAACTAAAPAPPAGATPACGRGARRCRGSARSGPPPSPPAPSRGCAPARARGRR